MKNIVGFFMLTLFAFGAFAEQDDRTMTFSVSPLAVLGGGIDVMYQIKMTDFLSITVPANFYYAWLSSKLLELAAKESDASFTEQKSPYEAAIGVGARFLMAKRGLNDTFYLEPRLSLGYEQFGVTIAGNKFDSQSMMLTPMLRFGWDWYWNSGFYMSLGWGLGANIYFNNKTVVPKEFKKNWFVKTYFPPEDRKYSFAWGGEYKLGFAF